MARLTENCSSVPVACLRLHGGTVEVQLESGLL